MSMAKVAISLHVDLLKELDRRVERKEYPNRSRVIQTAIREHLARNRKNRLAQECAKLTPRFEKALAEEGMGEELTEWPEY
jgi:metal-responsive CopG/Arc/MetJ family transcriptional regulator